MTIYLNAYLGQPDVRVRFNYVGTAGSTWGIDNVNLIGPYQPVTYSWSSNFTGKTITVSPTVTTDYTLTSIVGGCASTSSTYTLVVNPLPTATMVASTHTDCQNSTSLPTITFTRANGNSPYTFSYNINSASNENINTTI